MHENTSSVPFEESCKTPEGRMIINTLQPKAILHYYKPFLDYVIVVKILAIVPVFEI